MAVGIWQKLDQTGRNLLPFAVTVLMMLVAMAPTHVPGLAAIAPPLTLISVFYWAIHRPDLLRPSVVFVLGVLQDLLTGMPLGLSALVFTIAYWVVLTQRRFFLGNSFLLLWWGFGMVALSAAAIQWAVYSLTFVTVMGVRPAAFQALLAIAIFPLPAWLLMRLHRAFLS